VIVTLAVSKEGKLQEGSDRQLKQPNVRAHWMQTTYATQSIFFDVPVQRGR